jgi:Arc/MetJ-type ribon-helix-helix transcriptional regulator
MTDGTRPIEIPEQIAEQIATRIEGTEFDSVDDYVTVALEQLLAELRRQSADVDVQAVTDTTEEKPGGDSVADQLESLGYL